MIPAMYLTFIFVRNLLRTIYKCYKKSKKCYCEENGKAMLAVASQYNEAKSLAFTFNVYIRPFEQHGLLFPVNKHDA
jgi:hypothetical protein